MEAKKERNNRQYTFRDKTIYINIIMEAKKERNNRHYTFRDKTIYINDHLTPNNKHLFALAKQKKIANYKYLWM